MPQSHTSTWLPELQAILRGIAHSVSNRVAALGVLIELGDAETAEGRAGIAGELRQLQAVNVLLKQLAAEPRPAEAMSLMELCEQAASLHALRLELRDVPCRVTGQAEVAVRADRVRTIRLLLVLLSRAARGAADGVSAQVNGDDAEARVLIGGAGQEPLPAELHAMADELGGRLEHAEGATAGAPGAVALVLPSLQEIRRRERAG